MLIPTASQQESGNGHAATGLQAVCTSRRAVLHAFAALAGTTWVGLAPALGAEVLLRETAEDALGPFYPLSHPADQDFDLTVISGRSGRAAGRLLYVSGRVLNPRGEPVVNADVEVWQANAAGRYAHPGDTSKSPLDPNFQGYARIRTGGDGSYKLKTVHPGPYDNRTRHIHFDVRGRNTRLVTQMYFEGEPRNETDPLLKMQQPDDRKTLISRPGAPSATQESDALVVTWDIVLAFS